MENNNLVNGVGSSSWYVDKFGSKRGYQYFKRKQEGNILLNRLIKNHTEEIGAEMYHKICETSSKSHKNQFSPIWFIEKYGEEEGTIKYKEHSKKCSRRNKIEWFIEKYGEEEGTIKYKEKMKSFGNCVRREYFLEQANCNYDLADWLFKERQAVGRLEKFIERYGEEEGFSKWKARQEKWQDTMKAKPQKEIDRINKLKSHSLTQYIERYGEGEGVKRYFKKLEKISKNSYIVKYYSDVSFKVFDPIINWLVNEEKICGINKILTGRHQGEYYIRKKRKVYFYDFTIPDLNIIIEYNGTHVHPDIKRFNYQEFINWRHVFSGETAEDVNKRDLEKIKFAEKEGFKVLVIWGSDSIEENIEKAKNFIKDNYGL